MMEMRSVQIRLDQQEEQIQQLQSDIAEIKTKLQSYRVENAEFRKLMMAWMKEQGEQHVSGTASSSVSDKSWSGGIFVFGRGEFGRGGQPLPNSTVMLPETVKKIKLPELSSFDPQGLIQKATLSLDIKEESQGEIVIDPPENVVVVEDEELVPVLINEVWESELSPLIVESNTTTEEIPKESYALVTEQQMNNVLSIATEAAALNVDAVAKGIYEDETAGYSIYITGLPMTGNDDQNEDDNGHYYFEDIRVRDLPPPKPPDLRLGASIKSKVLRTRLF